MDFGRTEGIFHRELLPRITHGLTVTGTRREAITKYKAGASPELRDIQTSIPWTLPQDAASPVVGTGHLHRRGESAI